MKIVKVLKQPESPVYIVKMCGDYNDGDYSYSEEVFTDGKFHHLSYCLLEIQELVGRDYVNGDYGYVSVEDHIRDLQIKYDVEFDIPYGDTASDLPIHSLESLDIQFIDIDGKIYDVTLKD